MLFPKLDRGVMSVCIAGQNLDALLTMINAVYAIGGT
jgi:hypothetical protein